MDFQGQKQAELIYQIILSIFGVVSFVVGFLAVDFGIMCYIFFGGSVVAGLISVPDWPWFNRQNLKWQPPLYDVDKQQKATNKKTK